MKKSFLIAALVIVIPMAVGAVSTWKAPGTTPPGGNVDEPVNISNTDQSKEGGLGVGRLAVTGQSALAGKTGIGRGGTGSFTLTVGDDTTPDGSSIGARAYYYFSDENYKTNITTLGDALSRILKMRGVSFNWKGTGTKDVGVIAQEVEKVYPEVVFTQQNGLKSVEYGHLIGPLIEAIKAQQAQIEALKARISALEASR